MKSHPFCWNCRLVGKCRWSCLVCCCFREWPCLTVSSRSLWYVTGWGYLLCMLHSFTWIFMLFCYIATNSFETFYGACVPNVLWFISIFFSAAMFWSYLVKLLFNYFRIMLYVISRCCDVYSDKCFKKFYLWENGVLQLVSKQVGLSGQLESHIES